MGDLSGGHWITINGAHIYVQGSQSISDAIKDTTGKSAGGKSTGKKGSSLKTSKKESSDMKDFGKYLEIYKKNEKRIGESFGEGNRLKYESSNMQNRNIEKSFDTIASKIWEKHSAKSSKATRDAYRKAYKVKDYDAMYKALKNMEKGK